MPYHTFQITTTTCIATLLVMLIILLLLFHYWYWPQLQAILQDKERLRARKSTCKERKEMERARTGEAKKRGRQKWVGKVQVR